MKPLFLILLTLCILTACDKYAEGGAVDKAEERILKTWLYASKTYPNGTVIIPENTYTQTYYADGTMLLTSDFDTAYTETVWQWEFLNDKQQFRSSMDNWDTYVLSDIIKLTNSDLWIETQYIDNGDVFGEPDLEKHTAQ